MTSRLSAAWKQIRRTPYQALAAIMVLVFTFLATAIFALVSLGSLRIINHFETAPQVIAFFESGVDLTESEIAQIKSDLQATGVLESFKYVSTREAEAIYREKNQDDPLLLELVDYQILPPSIEVSAQSITMLPVLKEVLETQPGVTDIAYYEDIVRSLSRWVKNIRTFGSALISYLLVQSALVIMVVTSLKIQNRKHEVEIMRLLGANNWFIRWPFVFEGVFYGLVSAVTGWGLAYLVLLYATPFLSSWLTEVALLPVPIEIMLVILLAQVILGTFVGALSSSLAIKKYLKK